MTRVDIGEHGIPSLVMKENNWNGSAWYLSRPLRAFVMFFALIFLLHCCLKNFHVPIIYFILIILQRFKH